MQNRRDFLKLVAAGTASAALADVVRAAQASASPPNILFCIADDWGYQHTTIGGDRAVRTPTFDRIAREGVMFTHAFTVSPSCTPSRSAILTGQHIWRLKEAGNLWSTLRKEIEVYPDLLEAAGYHVGLQGKGFGPGSDTAGGRTRNPAGPNYKSFAAFLDSVPAGKPFCFWFGSNDPHRAYEAGSGVKSGKKLDEATVPPFLPDSPQVRSDILDYAFEVDRFDRNVGAMLKLLDDRKLTGNTIVVMTSDNGMPFPRAKANIYDAGTRLPLAIRWPGKFPAGRVVDDFVSFTDFAPTFLEAAGVKAPAAMTGRSLMNVLTSDKSGSVDPSRDHVLVGRERHAYVRAGRIGYPCRGLRTRQYLYIRNHEPDRWPAGDPVATEEFVGRIYGDIDNGPSKTYLLEHANDESCKRLFQLACGKRPAEELYDLAKDPEQLNNVAADPAYAQALAQCRTRLDAGLKETGDPRALGEEAPWDKYEYFGRAQTPRPKGAR